MTAPATELSTARTTPTLYESFGGTRLDETLIQIPLDQFVPSRWQPRRQFDPVALAELATDIHLRGVLVPPLVWRNEDGEYELLAGERRVRACYIVALYRSSKNGRPLDTWAKDLAEAGFARYNGDTIRTAMDHPNALPFINAIPCRLISGQEHDLHEIAIVDNLQRADLSPIDEAQALQDLISERGYTQRQLADRIGKSQTWISQRLNLLKLAPEVAAQVIAGDVDPATARDIARLDPAVQPGFVAHIHERKLKSKAAAGLVQRILDYSDPATYDRPNSPLGKAGNLARLAQIGLARLPQPAERQAALLRAAAQDSEGLLKQDQETLAKDLTVATGLADNRYFQRDQVWQAAAAPAGHTCATCQLNPYRDQIQAATARARQHNASQGDWPQCAPAVATCYAHTPAGAPISLSSPWLGPDFPFTDAERPHIDESGWSRKVRDVTAWLAIIQRVCDRDAERRARQAVVTETGLARGLAHYITLQRAGELDTTHFWAQPCAHCTNRTGDPDPRHACRHQDAPPKLDDWDNALARVWQSGNAAPIGRCRFFRLAEPAVNLPELPHQLSATPEGLLAILAVFSRPARFSAAHAAPAWLDVNRSNPCNPPTLHAAEPYLRKLLPEFTPGRRLALLHLWSDPFGFNRTNSPGQPVAADAYDPRRDSTYTYNVQQHITTTSHIVHEKERTS